jgi:hypothetical protein
VQTCTLENSLVILSFLANLTRGENPFNSSPKVFDLNEICDNLDTFVATQKTNRCMQKLN